MLIFDEYKYALKLLDHGFVKFMSNIDLTILAKYFRYIGKDDDQILEDLKNFCRIHNPEFNEVIFDGNVKNALEKSKKRPLLIPQSIPITKKEIDTIKTISNYNAEKVLFILLVIAKHYKINLGWNDYIANIKRTEIFTRAKVHALKKDKDAILTFIDRDCGLIDTLILKNIVNASFKINFVDEESEPIFYIDNFEDILKFYPHYCSMCGKQIDKRVYNHKFCEECWKERKNDKNKEWMKKYRNNN